MVNAIDATESEVESISWPDEIVHPTGKEKAQNNASTSSSVVKVSLRPSVSLIVVTFLKIPMVLVVWPIVTDKLVVASARVEAPLIVWVMYLFLGSESMV